MRIELDREKKITLLQALQRGYIDDEALRGWLTYDNTPREEIEQELDRLAKALHPDDCNRLQRLGLCQYCKQSEPPATAK